MIILALSIGIFGYLIYFLGVAHLLYAPLIIFVTTCYIGTLLIYFRKQIVLLFSSLWKFPFRKYSLFLLPLTLIGVINLLGALSPELAFDALWYHLTLPKLYLMQHVIRVIPGGLLYYSGMGQLGEMYYLVVLVFQGEILAKLIHFSFGIFSAVSLYLLSRKFLPKWVSFLVVILFYSNLVVMWESTTAYIDLTRTFFEVTALYALFLWRDNRSSFYLIASGLLLGMEVGTKFLAFGSVPLFLISIVILMKGETGKEKMRACKTFLLWTLIPILPWVLSAFFQTGNPIYPFFTQYYDTSSRAGLFNPILFFQSIFHLFTSAADPVSPIYLIILPLIPFIFRKFIREEKSIVIYSLLGIIMWYITPDTGGGRFIVPYLPGLSLVVGMCISGFLMIEKKVSYLLIGLTIFLCSVSIIYRGVATVKYVPYLLGKESKSTFLTRHLNFAYGDFYDTDSYFAQTITPTDTVLLIGFHNLYYVDFPFVDSSFAKPSGTYTYVATQTADLPVKFSSWKKVYYNKITDVALYKHD